MPVKSKNMILVVSLTVNSTCTRDGPTIIFPEKSAPNKLSVILPLFGLYKTNL